MPLHRYKNILERTLLVSQIFEFETFPMMNVLANNAERGLSIFFIKLENIDYSNAIFSTPWHTLS